MLAGRRPTVYGDGRQTRDYVFVADIATANPAAACAGELAYGEHNAGTGTEVSVFELIQTVAMAAGVDPAEFEPDFAPAHPVRRAGSHLGLVPLGGKH